MRGQARMGGSPSQLKGSLSRPCPDCGAGPGVRCLTFMTFRGQRVYAKGTRNKPHPERVHPTS
jgi:hypothetical protein